MASIRQQKIESAIQIELSNYFLKNSAEFSHGSMVTITIVRITPDLSLAKCYVSIFGKADKSVVLESIKSRRSKIRGEIGKRLKNMRKIPELNFFVDDSLDYAEKIEKLLKK
tara:strand:+ start:173 stop:508 length:336 start_codon:yes stop_codon:yes gene_type:complete